MQSSMTGIRSVSGKLARRSVQVSILAMVVFFAMTLIARLPAWPLIDNRAFDYLSTLSPPPLPKDGPIIVAIDEPSLAEIKAQWPWPRSLHARLIESLRAAGAKAIGLDIIFSEPSTQAEDTALAAALGPDVVLAGDETLVTSPQADQFVQVMPLQIFTDRGAMPGIASVGLGRDGVLRNVPPYNDGFSATIATMAGVAVQMPEEGSLIQTFGGARTYQTVSYYQALNPQQFLPPGFFKDRIVIIGLSLQNAPSIAGGGADAYATSYTVHTGKLTAGAEIQATILDNLRLEMSIRPADGLVRQVVLVVAVLLGAALVWRKTGWVTLVGVAAAVLVLFAASFAALHLDNLFASPIAPSLAFVLVAGAQTAFDYAQERRSRRQITRAFSQYLAPALVEQLAKDPAKLKLGGEKRVLSILFCDVRGFTTIAEQLKDDPQQLTGLINRLLTPLSDIVLSHGGTIDKYIGDCLMAFWNAPIDDPDHAVHAVSAALSMLESMQGLNEELEAEAAAEGRPHYPLKIGIGINTGECVVGNMGSTQRFDYSALGDAVNLAARLEGTSKSYGISLLLGEGTASAIGSGFGVFELDRITVKGRTQQSPVFTATRVSSANLAQAHAEFLKARYAGDVTTQRQLAPSLQQGNPDLSAYYGQAFIND